MTHAVAPEQRVVPPVRPSAASLPPSSQPASRPQTRDGHDLLFSLTLALVALLPRLFVAIAWAREPVWDGHYYHFGAERIALGLGYSEDVVVDGRVIWKPWVHYPVGYSALLALVYRVFGSGLSVAPVTNAVLGALLAVVAHRLARYYLSPNRARVAAGLVALHPGLIVYSAVVMNEVCAALLFLCATLAAVRWQRSWSGPLLGGALLGLGILVRPSTLLAVPLLALTQPRPWWSALLRGLAALAVAVVVVLPWTARNCRMLDGCTFVSTNAGWNLAIGALTETGRFRTLRASDGCPIVTGQVQQDRCWRKIGMAVIQRDVGAWLALVPRKLGHTFDHESFPVEYLREADPLSWPEHRRVAARHLLTLVHRILLIGAALGVVARGWQARERSGRIAQLAALGLIVLLGALGFLLDEHPFFPLAVLIPVLAVLFLPGRPRQGPVGRFLVATVAITAFVHALFFGDDRYHLVITPMLCLLAAAALRAPIRAKPLVQLGTSSANGVSSPPPPPASVKPGAGPALAIQMVR